MSEADDASIIRLITVMHLFRLFSTLLLLCCYKVDESKSFINVLESSETQNVALKKIQQCVICFGNM